MLEKEDFIQIGNIVNNALETSLEPIKQQMANLVDNETLDASLEPIKRQMANLVDFETLDASLEPIKQQMVDLEFELKEIKKELRCLNVSESEDVAAAYKDIKSLKKRVNDLEIRLNSFESAQG